MRTIGFNFAKVSAEKAKDFKPGSKISTNISFLDIVKEERGIVKEDSEVLRVSFNFSVNYAGTEKSEVSLTGFIILMSTKEESKIVFNSWKDKELPIAFKVPIFNFILNKCSVRALQLEEELGLPLHLPLPQLKAEAKDEKKDTKDDKKK